MKNLLFNMTRFLSIKKLVILGVVIMSVMITIFAFTIFYLSNTIKYDQDTMKHILSIEEQNKRILNDIKNINALDLNIITAKDVSILEHYEDVVIDTNIKHVFLPLTVENSRTSEYNDMVKEIKLLLTNKYVLQKDILNKKIIQLNYKNGIQEYLKTFNKHMRIIKENSDGIYGIASLKTKRFNRHLVKNERKSLNVNLLKYYSKVMSYAKDFETVISKLAININKIVYEENIEVINEIKLNEIHQNVMLLNNILTQFLNIEDVLIYDKRIKIIKSEHTDFINIIEFIYNLKKLQISQNKLFNSILEKRSINNEELFLDIIILNDISKKIKYDILEHSDSISQQSAFIIISIGTVFLIVMGVSASILIYRINYPLSIMVNFMKNLTLKKESLSNKLPIFTRDEFGKLSLSFNSMISKLAKSFLQIQKLDMEVRDTQKEVIFTMGAIGESRSKETGNHVKRVAEFSEIVRYISY